LTFRLHPKQLVAFRSKATEILYRGAAAGGKPHPMRPPRAGCYPSTWLAMTSPTVGALWMPRQFPIAVGGARGLPEEARRDIPQAPTSAALARGVGFVRHALPQSFQNPSNRSERSSVYRTVCIMLRWPRKCCSARVSTPSLASLKPQAWRSMCG
jgi:hypothetical protein